MLSLGNAFSQEDLEAFLQRVKSTLNTPSVELILELKYDGIAINLQYVKGKLVRALTRGDGVQGQDCTYSVKK
jgi:DNA ligase (NAD+)